MKQLNALVNELEAKIPQKEKLNTAVSTVTVGWHIQHSLVAALQIINSIEKSNPADYQWKFNFTKLIVYTFNKIPRGKGKAPDASMPKTTMDMDEMKQNIRLLRTKLAVLDTLQPDNYFKHPYFGNLNLKATVKMLKIHTKHHIDIINDIITG